MPQWWCRDARYQGPNAPSRGQGPSAPAWKRVLSGPGRVGGRFGAPGDRGSSAIELAILAPALLLISMLIIQWALWFEARGVALAAAQAGARTAREQVPGWQTQSVSDAESFYNRVGTKLISGLTVPPPQTAGKPPSQVYVSVTGQIPTLIPFIQPLTVTEKAGGPIECFRPAQAGGACQ
jgi:Flp pilus assembly protein TadG